VRGEEEVEEKWGKKKKLFNQTWGIIWEWKLDTLDFWRTVLSLIIGEGEKIRKGGERKEKSHCKKGDTD